MKLKQSHIKLLNSITSILTITFLLGSLIYLVLDSFSQGLNLGFRSLAACILPLATIFFVSSFTQIFQTKSYNRNFNLFVINALWTLFILSLWSAWEFKVIPLIEVLLSFMLASIFRRMGKNHKSQKLAARCYGVLTGLLGYICIFGFVR